MHSFDYSISDAKKSGLKLFLAVLDPTPSRGLKNPTGSTSSVKRVIKHYWFTLSEEGYKALLVPPAR